MSISFFFLSVSCALERTECGSSTPFPTLNNRHTQSFCLTQSLKPAGDKQQNRNNLKHILLLLFSLVFPFWLVGGRARSFIIQASPRAVTVPSSAYMEQNQQNVLMSLGRQELGVTAMDARHFLFKVLVATFGASLINLNVLRDS